VITLNTPFQVSPDSSTGSAPKRTPVDGLVELAGAIAFLVSSFGILLALTGLTLWAMGMLSMWLMGVAPILGFAILLAMFPATFFWFFVSPHLLEKLDAAMVRYQRSKTIRTLRYQIDTPLLAVIAHRDEALRLLRVVDFLSSFARSIPDRIFAIVSVVGVTSIHLLMVLASLSIANVNVPTWLELSIFLGMQILFAAIPVYIGARVLASMAQRLLRSLPITYGESFLTVLDLSSADLPISDGQGISVFRYRPRVKLFGLIHSSGYADENVIEAAANFINQVYRQST
jgi:hypothetical protein